MSDSKNSDPTNTNSTNSDPTNNNSSVNLSSYGSSNNSDYNANVVVNSNIYQLSFLGQEDEYYYEVDNIPVTNIPIFRKGQTVSSEVELKDIDTNYLLEGHLFTLVDIKEDDADSDIKYYLLTPVTAGGKQKIVKKSRKGGKKSRKGGKKSRKGAKKSRKGAKKSRKGAKK